MKNQKICTIAEAAKILEISERGVIDLAAGNLPICFHWRGNLAIYEKCQPQEKFRCYFDGYLRSKTPIRLNAITDGFCSRVVNGKLLVKHFSKEDDTLQPNPVEISIAFKASPPPPALNVGEFFTRLDDNGVRTTAAIPADKWRFHIDDLLAIRGPVSPVATADEEPTEPSAAPFSLPKDVDTHNTTGMVAWQAAILESWKQISEKYRNAPSARNVMSWCKSDGPRDVFGCEQPPSRESMKWIDSSSKDVHTVTLARIGTVISEWRKAGKIPAKK